MKNFVRILIALSFVIPSLLLFDSNVQAEGVTLIPGTVEIDQATRTSLLTTLTPQTGVEWFAVTDQIIRPGWQALSIIGLAGVGQDQKWNIEENGVWFGMVLLHQTPTGWEGGLRGTEMFDALLSQAPDHLLSASAKRELGSTAGALSAAASQEPIFPWARGTQMEFGAAGIHWNGFTKKGTTGWVAFDFLSDGNSSQGHAPNEVYSAVDGTVDYVCYPLPGETQTTIIIGNFTYTHLLYNSTPALGTTIKQGQYIGRMSVGNFPKENCAYQKNQYDPWFHVHWGVPNTGSLTVEGWTITWDPASVTSTTSAYPSWIKSSNKVYPVNHGTPNWMQAGTTVSCSNYSLDGVILFRDKNCGGASKQFTGVTFTNLPDFNDVASAIYVGSGWSAKVYEHNDRGGNSRCVSSTLTDLSQDMWGTSFTYMDEQISSVEIFHNTTCTTVIPVPNTPTNLHQTGATTMSVTFAWTDNSNNEDGFKIYRWDGASYVYRTSVGANVTSVSDAGFWSCGTTLFYTISAYNSSGESAQADPIAVSTAPCGSPPNVPTNLRSTGSTQTSITLAWDDNSSDELGFKVYRWDGVDTFALVWWPGANVTSWTDPSLQCGTTYYYRVASYNTYGDSAYTNVIAVATQSCGAPPNMPTLLHYTASQTSLALAWQDNSGNESGFRIYRWDGIQGIWWVVGQLGANVTGWTDTGLDCNSGYYYEVKAYNQYGESASEGWILAYTTTCTNPPNAPSNLNQIGLLSPDSIELTWYDNSNNEDWFNIYRWDGVSQFVWVGWTSANQSSWLDSNLPCGTNQYYEVSASNQWGESPHSAWTMATTASCPAPPNAPSNPWVSNQLQTSFTLNWTDNSNNEDGFNIRWWDGSQYQPLVQTGPNQTSIDVTSPYCSMSWTFAIGALNQGGESGYVTLYASTAACTTPTEPRNLQVWDITQNSLFLTWEDTSNNEWGFIVRQGVTGSGVFNEVDYPSADQTFSYIGDLQCGTSYTLIVGSYNGSGENDNVVSATTAPCNTFVYLPAIVK